MQNCLLIAEIGQAHEGSLGFAHSYIDAVAKAGVGAVKFQMHYAKEESSFFDEFRVKSAYMQDKTRFDYWKRMEFTPEQWNDLKLHAEAVGLDFICSPFSLYAVEILKEIKLKYWKIASGELENYPMLAQISNLNNKIFLSSGMSTYDELSNCLNFFQIKNRKLSDITLLQCTSEYPCPPETIGLNVLSEYKERFNLDVGLSDHSGTIYPSLAAVTLGATVIEVHVTFDKNMYGFDAKASLDMNELRLLSNGIKFIQNMMSNPVEKNTVSTKIKDYKKLFGRSIAINSPLKQGDVIKAEHLTYLKPGIGIEPKYSSLIINKIAQRDIEAGYFLKWDDIGE